MIERRKSSVAKQVHVRGQLYLHTVRFFLFWFWLFNLILCSMNCPGIQLQRSKHKTTWLVCKTEFQPICFCTSSNTYIRTSPNMNKLYCVIHLSFILLITAVNRAHTTAHAWNIVKQRRRMLFDDVRKKCFTIKISYFRSQNAAHLLSGFSISFSLCVCVFLLPSYNSCHCICLLSIVTYLDRVKIKKMSFVMGIWLDLTHFILGIIEKYGT